MRWFMMALAFLCATSPALAADSIFTFKAGQPIRINHIYTGPDGKSYWETLTLPPADAQAKLMKYLNAPAKDVKINAVKSGWLEGFHNTPVRVLAVMLQGTTDFDFGDGRPLEHLPAGEVLLDEDRTGKGHGAGCHSDTQFCMWVQVSLTDDAVVGLSGAGH